MLSPEVVPPSLAGLRDVTEELLRVDPHSLTDGELHDDVVGIVREIDRLTVALASRVAVWDAKMVWLLDGSASATARLARETRSHRGRAGRIVREAHQLDHMPSAREAIVSGQLSCDHVGLFARARTPERAALFARDEAVLVEQCQSLRFDEAERVVTYWTIRADAELDQQRRQAQPHRPGPGADDSSETNADDGDAGGGDTGGGSGGLFDQDPHRDSGGNDSARGGSEESGDRLFASRTVGGLRFDGWLEDQVSAEILLGQLDAIERELYLADRREGRTRVRSQRLAAALVEMARRSASAPPDATPAKPLFVLCVGEDRARDLCQLASGHVVRVHQVAPHLDDAVMERFIFDGQTIIAGSSQRCFTGLLRQAIFARDLYSCTNTAGCDAHGTDLDIDHITPASEGGPTDQFNGRVDCRPHNRHGRFRRNERAPAPGPRRDITPADLDHARERWRAHHGLPPLADDPDDPDATSDAGGRPSHRQTRIVRRRPRGGGEAGPAGSRGAA